MFCQVTKSDLVIHRTTQQPVVVLLDEILCSIKATFVHTCQPYKMRNRDPLPDPQGGLKYCLYCTVLALEFSGIV